MLRGRRERRSPIRLLSLRLGAWQASHTRFQAFVWHIAGACALFALELTRHLNEEEHRVVVADSLPFPITRFSRAAAAFYRLPPPPPPPPCESACPKFCCDPWKAKTFCFWWCGKEICVCKCVPSWAA
jgi:hypothetical protein